MFGKFSEKYPLMCVNDLVKIIFTIFKYYWLRLLPNIKLQTKYNYKLADNTKNLEFLTPWAETFESLVTVGS